MKISFYGAARTVTGSQHMIEVDGKRILLDCGLYQGKRDEARRRNSQLPFDASKVDVMVLSHAHTDHAGNIPSLVKAGFRGDIYATHATRDLSAVMLMDSAHIQESDAKFATKRGHKRGEMADIEPLYTQEDAALSLNSFTSTPYDRPKEILPGVVLTFLDAGHMLGSASVVLDIADQKAKKNVRVVFSGDIGRVGIPIIRDPQAPDSADILIMESTYGDRLHPPYADSSKELERIINETYRRGGKIIVPAFAVGRTQQLVYELHQLADNGDIPRLPIYVDSPLAVNTTDVFRVHPECYDSQTRAFLQEQGNKGDVFGFGSLTYIRSLEESKQLNFRQEPCIIISASGMLEAGRVLHHLKNNISDARNTILIVGWQAPDTLGRRLVEKAPQVKIFGDLYDNRAHVEVLNGFSGHAGQDELLTWFGHVQKTPRRTFLVHGEPESATVLQGELQKHFGANVEIPDWKQSFEL